MQATPMKVRAPLLPCSVNPLPHLPPPPRAGTTILALLHHFMSFSPSNNPEICFIPTPLIRKLENRNVVIDQTPAESRWKREAI